MKAVYHDKRRPTRFLATLRYDVVWRLGRGFSWVHRKASENRLQAYDDEREALSWIRSVLRKQGRVAAAESASSLLTGLERAKARDEAVSVDKRSSVGVVGALSQR